MTINWLLGCMQTGYKTFYSVFNKLCNNYHDNYN